jgi:topoisomerase-4 subunit A
MAADREPIVSVDLEEELAQSYGRYAQTIILDRAIPDARDGLKPVQRRILYAMFEAGNTADKPYRKSAKTVGDVMGNYHPHGDQSIYEALVRMAQPWKMRYPLIDGHGNFGSVDDDPPAAMRYTEARLSALAAELLTDIGKDTVDWRPNFDDKSLEPAMLPAGFPNLLCNGTSGVSTGFATEIPPHNLVEVAEAAIALLDDPDIDLDGLMEHVRGPDFPTGGVMMGLDGLREAYETGRGRVVVQSRWTLDKQRDGKTQILITELPYGVIKSKLVADMDGLRIDKVVHGVTDVRDESDREGLRIVVELSKQADVEGVLAVLLKKTELQVYYHFNMVAIWGNRPVEMGLRELLLAYTQHRQSVVRRRSRHDLDRAMERLHIVQGLIQAVDILDEIIAIIRASDNRADARDNLCARFEFTEVQADAILDLRLHRLTGLQILQLREEQDQLTALIDELEAILASERKLLAVVKRELRDVARKYGDARRTEIRAEVERYEVSVEATVRPAEVIVTLSREGYVRRTSLASFRATGASLRTAGAREGDVPVSWWHTNTTHKALILSRKGVCYALGVHQIPEDKWAGVGTALVNVVPIESDDRPVALLCVDFADAASASSQIVFATEMGMVKRVELPEFDTNRSSGIAATGLQPGDGVAAARWGRGDGDVILLSREGQAIRFREADISVQGRSARGVRGMGLDRGDAVCDLVVLPSAEGEQPGHLAVFTDKGRAKRTPLADIPRQLRAGKGSRIVKRLKRGAHRLIGGLWCATEDAVVLLGGEAGRLAAIRAGDVPVTIRDGNAFTVLPDELEVRTIVAEVAQPKDEIAAAVEAEDLDADAEEDGSDGQLPF